MNNENNINTDINEIEEKSNSRRNFLKFGAVATAVGVVGATGVTIAKKLEGTPLDHFPLQINDDYVRIDQRNQINTFTDSKALNDAHPERAKAFKNWDFYKNKRLFLHQKDRKHSEGQGTIDNALRFGGFSGAIAQMGNTHYGLDISNKGVISWQQHMLAKDKYQFPSKKEATLSIKTAAKLYGAVRCGITPRDERWDYDPLYNMETQKTETWENDFPFVPKSVIVIAVDMDYEAIATAPSWISDATVGDVYGRAVKTAGQLAIFMRQLGYKAVASLNDLGMNVPYAIAAGIGEGARNGAVITPEYGPRIRLAKVYTDFDFCEYTPPRDYGVASFCLNCKRCATSCPSKAITFDDPTWGPTYASDPASTWHASKGILKFHNDSRKCVKFWVENNGGCAACIAACPYNKPDFWHHRLIDAQNVIAPGPVHSFMREMDILFGYGTTNDPKTVVKFWTTGDKI